MSRRNEISVGAAVILGLLVLAFGTIWLQGVRFGSEEREVQARFREVAQLLTGSTVKFRGVPIGSVEAIELERGGGAVVVTMSIDADVTLPDDPAVVLAPESFFGDWQAEIVSRRMFVNYDFIEAVQAGQLPGYSLPDLSRLTAVADEIARNLATISNRVELAFTEETAMNVREAIENIQRASGELATLMSSQQVAIEQVASNLEQTSAAAEQAAVTLQRAFEQFEQAIGGGRLLNIVTNVESATSRADSLLVLLVQTSRDLQSTAESADTAFRRVGSIAAGIERGEGTLGRLIQDTTLYMSLVRTNIDVQALLRDIQQNPRRYINLRVF